MSALQRFVFGERAFRAAMDVPNEEGLDMRKCFVALCVAVMLAVALCVLAAAPAFATYTHVFSTSFGEAGSGDGQVELLESTEHRGGSGVAVNSATHDIYVADTGNHRVDEFSASGAFIRAWGWGVADGSTEALQTCTSACHAGLPGAGVGQLTEPSFIAVDNSGGPSEGDVYVADRTAGGSTSVVKFSASGGYISSNDGSGAILPIAGPFGSIGGIAVDTSGDLWVYADAKFPPIHQGDIGDMFEFAQDGSFITDWTINLDVFRDGIAIDSAHDLYLRSQLLYKYTSSGDLVGAVQNSGFPVSGVAVNIATDDVYVAEGSQIVRYASSCDPVNVPCTPVEEFASGGELNQAGNVAVDPGNDSVYVADVGNGRVAVFGRTPDVSTGAPASRTPTAAVVSGSVDPDNTPVSDCHFDYVTDAEYAPGEPDPYATGGAVPCDVTPSGSGHVTVHAEITGLTAGTAYHYRLQATNAYGTSFGVDETVPGTPPVIGSAAAVDVASFSAELRATINPEGGDTAYHFEYGPTTSYGASVPVPDADIGSGVADVSVSRRLQGLLAGTTYHYRVVAHNLLGTTFGADHAITTQPNGNGGGVDTCPNAAIRARQHAAALPDCRAYEQVSPPNRNGAPVLSPGVAAYRWQASTDGSAVTYTSSGVFADAQTGAAVAFPYLSSRAQDGWSTHSLLPPQSPGSILPFIPVPLFSSDLARSILANGSGLYGHDQPAIVPGEPADNTNLFLRDNSAGSYQLIDLTPSGATPAEAQLQLASPDLSHIFFIESAKLTPDAPPAGATPYLYEWSEGTVRLAGILPDGTPVSAPLQARVAFKEESNAASVTLDDHAVSNDGSRVFFQVYGEGGSRQGLYLRQNATSTVQLDASHGAGPGGGGEFALASGDGSLAFFVDDAAQGLTNDTVPGSATNLYRFDANSGALVNLTAAAHAQVLGVLGASEDGSYVYFAANGVLAPGASPGDCPEGQVSRDASKDCNLYLFHNGVTTFIATLNGDDVGDWHEYDGGILNDTAIVSPDGRYLAFQSLNSLTGYDNLAANGGECGEGRPRCAEVFLYDAAGGSSGKLSCASCNPSGGAPVGSSLIAIPAEVTGSRDGMFNYLPRYLSDSGRLFFNSRDALVPRDVNGQWDTYEYEPAGIGSCGQAQGCVSLVSSGRSSDPSLFRDASVTDEDVFFTTSDRLVAQDGDQSSDLYDARVDGGLAQQNEAPAPSCGGEACKPPASGQPAEQTPGSSGLSGAGNLALTTPSSNHGKPAKKKKHQAKKKRRQKKRRHARGRRANHNRGGAK